MTDIEKILAECRMNLERGRAVATGIGIFGLLVREEDGVPKALLRRRLEQDSLYQQDLSGKWELTGGGMDLAHFIDVPRGDYQEVIIRTLKQEFMEEAGLRFVALVEPLALFPAFLRREYTPRDSQEERVTIDLAFVMALPWPGVVETEEFHRKMGRGELHFFARTDLSSIEIVSPRTTFLIETGFVAYKLMRG